MDNLTPPRLSHLRDASVPRRDGFFIKIYFFMDAAIFLTYFSCKSQKS